MLLPLMVFHIRDVYDNKARFANMTRNFRQQKNKKSKLHSQKKVKIEISH